MRGQRHAPAAFYPRERPGTHRTGGWVGPRASLDMCGKSRLPPGFDSRTVQPVASRCADRATGPTRLSIIGSHKGYVHHRMIRFFVIVLVFFVETQDGKPPRKRSWLSHCQLTVVNAEKSETRTCCLSGNRTVGRSLGVKIKRLEMWPRTYVNEHVECRQTIVK
jgi:hypothetical protein